MQTGMLHLHNILRWIILILLLLSLIKAFSGWQSRKMFTAGDKRVWLFTLIFTHINLVVGLYLLFLGRFGILNTTLPPGTSVMKNSSLRFFWVEHPLLMLISVILITLGYGMSKKPVQDSIKFKKAFWFFLIALILILAAIPWPGREVARPLFPGM
ncbi:MAG: hypothetical protein ABWZ25_01050 [Chitinophagaceae bacterium]